MSPDNDAEEVALKLMEDPISGGVFSVSRINMKNKSTYQKRKIGIVVEHDNPNITSISSMNANSGVRKTIDSQKEKMLSKKNIDKLSAPNDKKFSEDEVFAIKEYLMKIKNPEQIKDLKIGDKVFKKELLRQLETDMIERDSADAPMHNEEVIIQPRAKAIIVMAKNFDEVPDWVIKLADKYKKPIILQS